jgi:transposase
MMHRWKQEYLQDEEHSFPGKGHMKPQEEEIFKLKKKIADLEEDRAILKKALAILICSRKTGPFIKLVFC